MATAWKQMEDAHPGSQALLLRLLPTLPFKAVGQRLLWWRHSSGRFHQAENAGFGAAASSVFGHSWEGALPHYPAHKHARNMELPLPSKQQLNKTISLSR